MTATPSTHPAIDVRGAGRSFVLRPRVAGSLRRRRVVVDAVGEVTFAVPAGQIVGYIGPNGAGKSTTVKMLSGILTPTRGSITVAGLDPSRQRVALAQRIGVVFGQRTTLWWDLPLRDSFALLRHIYSVDATRHAANRERLVELLDVGSFIDTPVRQLSLGQRMRGDLIAALLHDPEVLFLDEPTIGLDIVSKTTVRAFLAEHNRERGTTIVLTTHDLVDIEALSHRILVIDHGIVVHDGTVEDLKASVGADRIVVVDLLAAQPPLAIPGATCERVEGARQWLRVPAGSGAIGAVVRAVTDRDDVADLSVAEPDIEDVVRRIYAR